MKCNHIFIPVIGVLLSSNVYGLSPVEHKVAVYGCKQAILEGVAKSFAKKFGHDPNNLSLEQIERVEARLENEVPEIIDGIEKSCNCMIDIIVKEEGGINADIAEAVMEKHMSRLEHECFDKSKMLNEFDSYQTKGNSQASPPKDYKIEKSKESRGFKPHKIYRED